MHRRLPVSPWSITLFAVFPLVPSVLLHIFVGGRRIHSSTLGRFSLWAFWWLFLGIFISIIEEMVHDEAVKKDGKTEWGLGQISPLVMLGLQLRPCYNIVYPGASIKKIDAPSSERGDTLVMTRIAAASNEVAGADSSDSDAPPHPADGEATSGVLNDTIFDEATHSSAVRIGGGTFTNPRHGNVMISGGIFNDNVGNMINIGNSRNSNIVDIGNIGNIPNSFYAIRKERRAPSKNGGGSRDRVIR